MILDIVSSGPSDKVCRNQVCQKPNLRNQVCQPCQNPFEKNPALRVIEMITFTCPDQMCQIRCARAKIWKKKSEPPPKNQGFFGAGGRHTKTANRDPPGHKNNDNIFVVLARENDFGRCQRRFCQTLFWCAAPLNAQAESQIK